MSCFSPLWSEEVIVVCQTEVLQLHPEPDPRSASTAWTANFRAAAAPPPKSDKSNKKIQEKPASVVRSHTQLSVSKKGFSDATLRSNKKVGNNKKKFPWTLTSVSCREEGKMKLDTDRGVRLGGVCSLIYLFLRSLHRRGGRGGAQRISQSVCSITSLYRGLTSSSSIISIDLDSDRCRPRPPEAPLADVNLQI